MNSRHFYGLWVTGAALTSHYSLKQRTNVFAENVEEIPEQPLEKLKQKSCIIIVGTTGK
jgi:hypothetical protein